MAEVELKKTKKHKSLAKSDNGRLILTALIAIVLAFLVAIIVMLATGIKPGNFFSALLRTFTGLDFSKAGTDAFFKPRYVGEFIQISLPLIMTGLALGFAYRCGLFNIGAEGQVIAGILGANLVAILVPWQSKALAVLAVLTAGLFGALWALIPGLLKAHLGVSEVVSTIMFNYMAIYMSNAVLKALPGSNTQRTVDLPEQAMLTSPWLREITGNSRLHWGILIVLICIPLYNILLNRTSFGYEIRAVGFNRDAARYAGMKVKSRIVASMMISGLFAGLAGACLALGTFKYGRILPGFENYGFDGIAVGLLGGTRGVGILLAGLLMGGLRSGQALMQAQRVPLEIAQIVSALIVLFVAMQKAIDFILSRMAKKRRLEAQAAEAQVPEAQAEEVPASDDRTADSPAAEAPATDQSPDPAKTKEGGK